MPSFCFDVGWRAKNSSHGKARITIPAANFVQHTAMRLVQWRYCSSCNRGRTLHQPARTKRLVVHTPDNARNKQRIEPPTSMRFYPGFHLVTDRTAAPGPPSDFGSRDG